MDFKDLCSILEMGPDHRIRLKGQEMILLPRHFFQYILQNVREVAGAKAFERIFKKAGYEGAYTFCKKYMAFHGCSAEEAVKGYLAEMSLRGWGRFSVVHLDPRAGEIEVELTDSALHAEGGSGNPSGHVIWEQAVLGTMDFIQEQSGMNAPLEARHSEDKGRCHIHVRRKRSEKSR